MMIKRKWEKPEEPAPGPVSAFAARLATHKIVTGGTSQNVVSPIPELPPNKETSRPKPAKRRKTKGEVQPPKPPTSQDNWPTRIASTSSLVESSVQVTDKSALQQKHVVPDTLSGNGLVNSRAELEDQDLSSDSQMCFPSEVSIQHLSTFIPSKDNILGETAEEWTIRLKMNDTVTLVGQYDIWVRTGAVSILGAILHASPRIHRVYAPSTHSLPSVRPLWNPYGSEKQSIVITISTCNTRVRMLRELSPKFGRLWNKNPKPRKDSVNGADLSQRSFLFLKSSAEDLHRRPLHRLDVPNDWQTMIRQLKSIERKSPTTVLICGPKGSGKSTLCRILINSMLTSSTAQSMSSSSTDGDGVAFLDLDPGQPEYSPSGEVSLVHMRSCNLGVPFTHPTVMSPEGDRLIRAHHVGRVSLKDDPGHYLKCAMDLLHHYTLLKLQYPACPLVVNCSGWVLGSGLEVLTELIRHWAFTNIIYTSKLGPLEVVETLAESAYKAGTPFHTVASQSCQTTTRTAADLRIMQTLSYFHLDEPEARFLRWNPSLINEIEPVVVRYSGPRQDIFGILTIGEEQGPEYLATILEGFVVGLVVIEDEAAIHCVENSCQFDSPVVASEQYSEEHDAAEQESNQQARFGTFQVPRETFNDSESDQASTDSTGSSRSSSFRPYAGRRKRHSSGLKDSAAMRTNSHLKHSSISRTAEDLPYVSTGVGTNAPLDPSKSYSIGQALVRGINVATKTLHLITPIPQAIFEALRHQNARIMLVRGKLDAPTWAYHEEYEAAAARRRRARWEEGGKPETFGADEIRAWAEGIPWAKVVDGKEPKSQGAKVWRVRRNLRTRSLVEGRTRD